MLQKALQFLREHNEIAFATCEGNLPKIRVFQIMKQEGTVLYFATSPKKSVYKQLHENPNVELLASADKVSVRCVGTVTFDVSDDVQQWIYDNNEVLPRLYTSYDKMVYFSLNIAELDYYDLRPTPPMLKHFDLRTGDMVDGYVGERYSQEK
ncbi:MAG: pyridoxamine 5'-phosphate oxidase family protein [Bacteroidales bacterium]|nr:pyridoxamine 5'-phosphate oxidase family protein [Bacteroidales bacterium]